MSKAPERIWLTGFVKDQYGARLGRGTISDLDHGSNPDYPEYVRADRIEELEAKLAMALEGFEELACLGNGDRHGNSFGNLIAQEYIAELTGGKDE